MPTTTSERWVHTFASSGGKASNRQVHRQQHHNNSSIPMFLPKGKLAFLLAQAEVHFHQERQNNKFILLLLGRKANNR